LGDAERVKKFVNDGLKKRAIRADVKSLRGNRDFRHVDVHDPLDRPTVRPLSALHKTRIRERGGALAKRARVNGHVQIGVAIGSGSAHRIAIRGI
jgi:hypothetical protein